MEKREIVQHILVTNVGEMFLFPSEGYRKSTASKTERINDGLIYVEKGKIVYSGPSSDFAPEKYLKGKEVLEIDAKGSFVSAGFVDSHTHLLFAGTRADEFQMRREGKSYSEIAKKGGGILRTVEKTRATPPEELYELAKKRLWDMLKEGTTVVEIKTGYGLSLDGEKKLIETLVDLKNSWYYQKIFGTYLGAHAVPPEFNSTEEYLDSVVLPLMVEAQKLDFVDVFCEEGFFSPEDTLRVIEKAESLKLKVKLHANELKGSCCAKLGIEHKALSVDHVIHFRKEDFKLLEKSETVLTLLPSTVLNIFSEKFPPWKDYWKHNAVIALATDFNPGTSFNSSLYFTLTLAVTLMRMDPVLALAGVTINGA